MKEKSNRFLHLTQDACVRADMIVSMNIVTLDSPLLPLLKSLISSPIPEGSKAALVLHAPETKDLPLTIFMVSLETARMLKNDIYEWLISGSGDLALYKIESGQENQ